MQDQPESEKAKNQKKEKKVSDSLWFVQFIPFSPLLVARLIFQITFFTIQVEEASGVDKDKDKDESTTEKSEKEKSEKAEDSNKNECKKWQTKLRQCLKVKNDE